MWGSCKLISKLNTGESNYYLHDLRTYKWAMNYRFLNIQSQIILMATWNVKRHDTNVNNLFLFDCTQLEHPYQRINNQQRVSCFNSFGKHYLVTNLHTTNEAMFQYSCPQFPGHFLIAFFHSDSSDKKISLKIQLRIRSLYFVGCSLSVYCYAAWNKISINRKKSTWNTIVVIRVDSTWMAPKTTL